MKQKIRTGIFAAIGMLLMILDTKTALSGAQSAITLCLMTVIPSLLPFFLFSILLTESLSGLQTKLFAPLGRLCRMPAGSESLLLIGLLGGYPTGAQAVADCYANGQLSKTDARRMLGFCSNAGPSFLFGITALAFTDPAAPWLLWSIHIFSALMTGALLPGGSRKSIRMPRGKPISVSAALTRSLAVMARICGWILIFRVILAFLIRWILWLLPTEMQAIIFGITELTIGCANLSTLGSEGLRFTAAAAFLGFGGICVVMQTLSVTEKTGIGMYLPGKLLQCLISILLAAVTQSIFLENSIFIHPGIYIFLPLVVVSTVFILQRIEKKYSNLQPVIV